MSREGKGEENGSGKESKKIPRFIPFVIIIFFFALLIVWINTCKEEVPIHNFTFTTNGHLPANKPVLIQSPRVRLRLRSDGEFSLKWNIVNSVAGFDTTILGPKFLTFDLPEFGKYLITLEGYDSKQDSTYRITNEVLYEPTLSGNKITEYKVIQWIHAYLKTGQESIRDSIFSACESPAIEVEVRKGGEPPLKKPFLDYLEQKSGKGGEEIIDIEVEFTPAGKVAIVRIQESEPGNMAIDTTQNEVPTPNDGSIRQTLTREAIESTINGFNDLDPGKHWDIIENQIKIFVENRFEEDCSYFLVDELGNQQRLRKPFKDYLKDIALLFLEEEIVRVAHVEFSSESGRITLLVLEEPVLK